MSSSILTQTVITSTITAAIGSIITFILTTAASRYSRHREVMRAASILQITEDAVEKILAPKDPNERPSQWRGAFWRTRETAETASSVAELSSPKVTELVPEQSMRLVAVRNILQKYSREAVDVENGFSLITEGEKGDRRERMIAQVDALKENTEKDLESVNGSYPKKQIDWFSAWLY